MAGCETNDEARDAGRLPPTATCDVVTGSSTAPRDTADAVAITAPPIELVAVSALPFQWTAAPGWSIGAADVLGDVTGDGAADGVVYALDAYGAQRALLIAGPLRRALTLPGDELAAFPQSGDVTVGDVTGDGVPELLVVAMGDQARYFLEAPFAGESDPTVRGVPLLAGADYADLDGDGVLDQIVGEYQRASVTWGPHTRWSAAPDLVLDSLTCDAEPPIGFMHQVLTAYDDLDGDGRRELRVEDYYHHCPPLTFPMPTTSPFAPGADPSTVVDAPLAQGVADQSGDGASDVWLWQARTVEVGPVTFSDGAVTGTSSIVAPADLSLVYPTRFDVTGDGLADFLSLDGELDDAEFVTSEGAPPDMMSGEVLVVLAGGADLATATFDVAWDLEGGAFDERDVFIEDGVVGVLVSRSPEGVTAVDLGAGTAE